MKQRPSRSGIRGISIFEACAGLVLVAFVLFAGGRLYQNLSPRLLIISARHSLMSDLAVTHAEAQKEKKDISVAFAPIKQSYSIEGRVHYLRVGFGIVMDNEDPGDLKDTFVFTFHPDGTATGGSISLYKKRLSG